MDYSDYLAEIAHHLDRIAAGIETLVIEREASEREARHAAESTYLLLKRKAQCAADAFAAADKRLIAMQPHDQEFERIWSRVLKLEADAITAEAELEDFVAAHPGIDLEADLELEDLGEHASAILTGKYPDDEARASRR